MAFRFRADDRDLALSLAALRLRFKIDSGIVDGLVPLADTALATLGTAFGLAVTAGFGAVLLTNNN